MKTREQRPPAAFQINEDDNVATALAALRPGPVAVFGDAPERNVTVLEDIPAGHKVALRDIAPGEDIVKYGVAIGRASAPIRRGGWVHLHCMGSKYDELSNDFDPVTGTSRDTRY